MKRTVVHKAYPSLRGLVSDEIGYGPRLYAWPTVSPRPMAGSTYFSCFDREGRQRHEGDRLLRLQVDGLREHSLANRAWQRGIRQAWQRGDLVLEEAYSSDRPRLWSAIVCSLTLLGLVLGGAGVVIWRLCHASASVPLRQDLQWIETTFVVGMLAVFGTLAAVFADALWMAVVRLTKPIITRARFDADGVQAHWADGSEISGLWRDLQSIHWGSRVRFRSGTELWLPIQRQSRRTRHLLRLVQEQFLPEAVARRRKARRTTCIVLSLLVLAIAVLTGLFVDRLNDQGLTHASGPLAALLVVCCGAAWLLLLFIPGLRRFEARWRRRKRR